VTGVEVTIGNCFPSVWEILPSGAVTTVSICFVIPHSNTKKYEYTANNQRDNNAHSA